MKEAIFPITVGLLIISLAGCSVLPASGTLLTSTPASPSMLTSGYEPQPGDDKLKRDQVFLELASGPGFITTTTDPSQVIAVQRGNLPDPCHQLRVVVMPPDANNAINLDIYSLVDPGKACITVLKPFTASIPLGKAVNIR